MSEPRILIYDIETSLQPAAVFSLLGNDYINHANLLSERHLVSVCWRWFGEKKIHSCSLLNDPKRFEKDPHDDRVVAEKLHKLFSEADVIVAHYGDKFDKPYSEGRMLFHGLNPLPPVTTIDTKKVASQRFLLNSNKLDYLGQFLGLGKKKDTPTGLWLDVMKGSKKAIKQMVSYNKRDVELLEDVFRKLIPYIPNYISRELFGGTGCPRCGSKSFQSRGTHRAVTKTYNRFQCNDCGGWFRELKATKATSKYRIL